MCITTTQAQNVNIPDANFKAYLVGNTAINTNGDSEIQVSEAEAFTGIINCPSRNITNLTGIEVFTNLTELWCSNNPLKTLNVSSNTMLNKLLCSRNQLSVLDVSNNKNLEMLSCYKNQITSLDLKANTKLNELWCYENKLTALDLSINSNLTSLICRDNQLVILNVANGNNQNFTNFQATLNPYLTCIQVDDPTYSINNWVAIDQGVSFSEDCSAIWCTVNIPDANFKAYLAGNTTINTNEDSEIQCSEATAFTGTINCSNKNITDLTGIEAFTNLTALYCDDNQLTALNVNNNTSLTRLGCAGNLLTTLDLSANPELSWLDCTSNQLSTLDLSNSTALIRLSCASNQLTTLDMSANTDLIALDCSLNRISSLDLSSNTDLTQLRCGNNQLASLNVTNGNNRNFKTFEATNNHNLTCIQVDDAAWSTANWNYIDPEASFSEACSITFIEEKWEQAVINIYPNPVQTHLNVNLKKATTLQIVNLSGVTVVTQKADKGDNIIDVSRLSNGVYFLQTSNTEAIKFIKN